MVLDFNSTNMEVNKSLFSQETLVSVAERHGTPVWLYNWSIIENRIQQLNRFFDVVRFAQKANSNLAILQLMRSSGVLLDAVSAGEMVRALRVFKATESVVDKEGPLRAEHIHDVVFTADVLDRDIIELLRANPSKPGCEIAVNVGSIDMIRQLSQAGLSSMPLVLRINPGFGHGHSQKVNTGGSSSKHGIWHTQIQDAKQLAQDLGMSIIGLHMHIGSGSDFEHLSRVSSKLYMLLLFHST